MTTKQRLEKYLDIELPVDQLLFHVAMLLSLTECSVMVLFALLLRMDFRIPLLLFLGILFTVAAIYTESRGVQTKWISAVYIALMHFILLPAASFYVPYAIYDFPVYFLTGIAYTAILLKKRWVVCYIALDMLIDLICIHRMLMTAAVPAAALEGHIQYSMVLFIRIIMALSITGTVCGLLISYRNRVLRREIARSAAMEQRAEQLSYAKNMFLVNVSHEIRTPLNAILGITELLFDLDVEDRVKENAFHLSNSSKALLSITNELMDFSKLDDSDLVVTDKLYYIGDICNELVNVISVRFADYKTELFVDIEPDIPAQLCGDETMVRQLMLNVLTGIVKSLESGDVFLKIRKEDVDRDQIRLHVEMSAEGVFRHSYRESLYHDNAVDMACACEEKIMPLPHRLVQLLGGELSMDEELNRRKYYFVIPQRYVSDAVLAEPLQADGVHVLFYENTAMQGSMLARTLQALQVNFCQAQNNEFFFGECVKPEYTHIMIATERYDGIKEKLEKLLSPQSIILIGANMLTYEDVLVKTTFSRPVNCLNLDALLGNKQNSTIRHVGYRGGFVCPEARVMVVDDNIVNLEVATSLLKRYQAQVLVAASGKECLKMLQKERVDFIFLDYMMPEMDGIDTLKNIKALGIPGLDKVPIAALTANAVSGAREMFLEAGFDEYLSKPIEREKFEKILRAGLPEDKIIYTPDKETKAG